MRTPVGRIVPHDDGIADAELLQRYSLARDEVAFELLVRRHADTVWAACRSVIAHDTHAAEDAFQATFLTLARKAASIRTLNVAGWLHAVGVNTALKQLQQQRTRPRPLVDDFAVVSPEPRHEESRILHEELANLREPYRVAIVLCELNDYTHAEAAKQLGVPVGTLAARLSRGRAELKQRLERRGVALTILTTR